MKYIKSTIGEQEFYYLNYDPYEINNKINMEDTNQVNIKESLNVFIRKNIKNENLLDKKDIEDKEMLKKLKSIGYVN